MLPRSNNRYFAMVSVIALAVALIAGVPVRAAKYAPPVSYQEFSATGKTQSSVGTFVTTEIQPIKFVSPFTLVGITWSGSADPTSRFQVRIHENGIWLDWQELTWSSEHGADEGSSEAFLAKSGTDPLISAPSDAIAARVINQSGTVPTDIRLVLSNSDQTQQDKNLLAPKYVTTEVPSVVTSPQGAVVPRPKFITRAQWGADESLRNQDPGVGTKIIAGFMHHTASTNSYAADQGPAQMRILYAYYTKGLHYKDLAYSFLVDRYGNIYEGRSGCPRKITQPCDGPSIPAIGAHTAAMNLNTFAVSVIGNYQTTKPPAKNLALIVESVASVMAWKIAPYGLKPDGFSDVPVGADPDNLSRYAPGDIAHIQTISGHRDVGRTVCPGQYLYPSLPDIRARINELLKPAVQDAEVIPNIVDATSSELLTMKVFAPAGASWSISITDPTDSSEMYEQSGTAEVEGLVTTTWDRVLNGGGELASGKYFANFSLAMNGVKLPTVKQEIIVGTAPTQPVIMSGNYVSKTKRRFIFTQDTSVAKITYKYRTYSMKTKHWSKWKLVPNVDNSLVLSKLRKGNSYKLQVLAQSALGTSKVVSYSFKHKK